MRLEIHKTSFFNFLTWIYTSLKVVLLKKVHCNLPKVWFFKVKLENFQICCQFCSPFALVFLFSSWWQWSAMTRDWPNLCLVIQCGNVKRNIQENAWKVKYHGWLSDTLERTFPFENIMRTCVPYSRSQGSCCEPICGDGGPQYYRI